MEPIQPTFKWVPGIRAWDLKLQETSYIQDEGRAVYTAIPSTFCTFYVHCTFHIYLLLIDVAGVLIRGYIKDRNLCVILELQVTLHSSATCIYQVLVFFITLINTNQ
jgi:hypothetical protein